MATKADLTAFQASVLARLQAHTGRTRDDGGPWERAWVYPRTSAESRAMAALHERGLVERRWGRPGAKVPHAYRALDDGG